MNISVPIYSINHQTDPILVNIVVAWPGPTRQSTKLWATFFGKDTTRYGTTFKLGLSTTARGSGPYFATFGPSRHDAEWLGVGGPVQAHRLWARPEDRPTHNHH